MTLAARNGFDADDMLAELRSAVRAAFPTRAQIAAAIGSAVAAHLPNTDAVATMLEDLFLAFENRVPTSDEILSAIRAGTADALREHLRP